MCKFLSIIIEFNYVLGERFAEGIVVTHIIFALLCHALYSVHIPESYMVVLCIISVEVCVCMSVLLNVGSNQQKQTM